MTLVKREGLPALIDERQEAAARYWGRYRSLQRFLADHYADRWERIRTCRTGYYKTYPQVDTDWFKASRGACHELPVCILCVRAEAVRRVHGVQDRFARCTPAGKQPRFTHIVQVAPIYDDGTGWGMPASQNLEAFGAVVFGALRETYGEGIGAVLSYQDFGKHAFNKRHPHMDLTLNGWMLQDDKPVPTPQINLRAGGRKKWEERIVARAQAIQLGAERGSCYFGRPREGFAAYAGILKYQLRELVDLRMVEYSRDEQMVWWNDAHAGHREKFKVTEFMAGLTEYAWRLRQWLPKSEGGLNLHRGYGHLAKGSTRKTQKLMGGAPLAHKENCPCAVCGEWERVFLDEVEESMRSAPTLPASP